VPLSPTNSQLGAAIRAQRQRQERSIEDLAAQAGITWQYLSGIELGRKNPSWKVVTGIADGLGVGIAELAVIAGGIETS
jgi:transcriptional regulator with XRE-family HTH domain